MNESDDYQIPASHFEHAVVCPKCLLANSPTAAFCADCGAPIGMVAMVDPIQCIQAEGFSYRSAVDGPPALIVVVGIWLIFGPPALGVPFFVFSDGFDSIPHTILYTLLGIASAVVLYRTTKNYAVKSRAARERTAEPLSGDDENNDDAA